LQWIGEQGILEFQIRFMLHAKLGCNVELHISHFFFYSQRLHCQKNRRECERTPYWIHKDNGRETYWQTNEVADHNGSRI
jgi:hypothetical protein